MTGGGWVPQETRDAVVELVTTWSKRTALPERRFIGWPTPRLSASATSDNAATALQRSQRGRGARAAGVILSGRMARLRVSMA